MKSALRISEDVAKGLKRKAAIVALESTIISHGMPYPQNVETARALERIIREHGAIPATIAVMGGRIRVGLDDTQLDYLASGKEIRKISSADLAHAVACEIEGATTVAATMICAHLAGIAVFATGGIGGVHRGAQTTMDVSADLTELSRTPVTVVCGGAKALLDIPKTLEALETLGIPVVCYGTDQFPAFWSRTSGLDAPLRLDSVDEIARLVRTQRRLGLPGGTLVANPVPADAAIPYDEMASHIESAMVEAGRAGVRGKSMTPVLLEHIGARTGGRSLEANIELVKSNARLASRLALALAS